MSSPSSPMWRSEGRWSEIRSRSSGVILSSLCSLLALIGVGLAAILARRVVIGEKQLSFRSRFKERIFLPENIEWIAFHRENALTTRGERAYPTARIKLRNKRRRLRLRPGGF